ncbi:RNA polymerase sigma factor [Paenibacillus sp. NFR01]|uniref:RNA polymerase sigma factor n=1 Tax=Paenibacillus sp. NFR01 TaxID=1566279 RepID=UPI0008BA9D52|nr:sigma-70 family RNA polymerase sigma factor [Paenibacillus sp. NFR01]SEU20742.1 RNA polymerase sigma-70 factor, ECF subfamily [Paenibacillus sp. NFR01]
MNEEIEYRIRRVQAGETGDYAYIVQAYQRQILVYCWRMLGNEQEAEDAVQDILVNAFEKIRMYKPSVNFSSWLYKLAYNHCLNVLRRRKLQRSLSRNLSSEVLSTNSAAQVVERGLFSEPLSRALLKLSAEERNLLVLRVFEEKPFSEIAQIIGKSTEAAKKRYSRTLTKLKQIMQNAKEEDSCLTYSSWIKSKA